MAHFLNIIGFALLISSVSSRGITSRQLQTSDESDTSDSVVIESGISSTPTQTDEEAADRSDDFPFDSEGDDEGTETGFKSLVDAAALVHLFADNDDDDDDYKDEEHEYDEGHPNTKNYGILAQLNPGQFFGPIGQTFAAIGSALTHPNGFGIPRPIDLWSKIQQASSSFFSGANSAIFGLGQLAQDYPFPYRRIDGRSLRDDLANYGDVQERVVPGGLIRTPAYLREKLGAYKEQHVEKAVLNRTLPEAYFFPYLLGADRIREFAKNATG